MSARTAITVDTAALRDASADLSPALPRPQAQVTPVERALLLHGTNHLVTTAHHRGVGIARRIAADGGLPPTLVNAGPLIAMVNTYDPAIPTTLSVEGVHLYARQGRRQLRLLTLPVDDHPALPSAAVSIGDIPGPELADLARRVCHAAARSDTHTVLSNVRIDVRDGTLHAVASDRVHLMAAQKPITPHGVIGCTLLVPAPALRAIAATSLRLDHHVHLGLNGPHLIASTATTKAVVHLATGTYPNVMRLLAPPPTTIETHRKDMLAALTTIKAGTAHRGAVRLVLANGSCTLTSGDGSRSCECPVPISASPPHPFNIRLRADLLKRGIQALPGAAGSSLHLGITAPDRPLSLTTDAAPGLRYLLMPLRPD